MATVSTLTIDLVANSAKLVGGLKKANAKTGDWAKKTRKSANVAGQAFTAMSAAAVAGLSAIYLSTAKTADELGKFSDQIGEAPEKIRGLQRAAELTGVSNEKLNKSLEKMAKTVGEARAGLGAAVPYLDQMGLSSAQFFNLRPGDQFAEIADKINALGTQQEKAAAASAIFGRDGGKLLNTLALGKEGLEASTEEVIAYGLALSRVDIAKIEAANDAWLRASEVTQSFSNQFTAELAPVVEAVAVKFAESAKEAGGLGKVATNTVNSLVSGFAFAADVVNGLKVVFLGVKAAAINALGGITSGIAFIDIGITALINKIPGLQATTNDTLQGVAASIAEKAQESAGAFQVALLTPPPSESIKPFVSELMDNAEIAAKEVAAERQGNIGTSLASSLLQPNAASFDGGNIDDNGETNPFFNAGEDEKQQALDLWTAFQEQKFSVSNVFALQEQALRQEHEAELSLITDKEERRRVKARQTAEAKSASSTKAFFASGIADLTKNSKAAFKIQKAMKIAETVQNTHSAAMGAYNALAGIPIVGPALGAAAAAAAIAFGGTQINAIKSQQFGGGGSVSSGSPSRVSASSSGSDTQSQPVAIESPQAETTQININLGDEDALTSVKTVRRLIERIAEEAPDMNVNFDFAGAA